jgi:hypothetical protein
MFYRFFTIVILLVIICVSNISCQVPKKVEGGYKKCIEYSYEYLFGKVNIRSKTKVSSYKYDEKGNLIEKTRYNADGSVSSRDTFKLVDIAWDEILNKTNELLFNTCRFDKYPVKNTIEASSDSECFINYEPTYKYNKNGNMIEKVVYRLKGLTFNKYITKYDGQGKIIEYDELVDEMVLRKSTYKYDYHGNMIDRVEHLLSVPNIKYEYIYSK